MQGAQTACPAQILLSSGAPSRATTGSKLGPPASERFRPRWIADGTFCIVEGTWAVVDLYAYYDACRGVTIRTDGSNAVCIFDLSLDDPESDSATGSVPRALLVLLLPGLLALGLL